MDKQHGNLSWQQGVSRRKAGIMLGLILMSPQRNAEWDTVGYTHSIHLRLGFKKLTVGRCTTCLGHTLPPPSVALRRWRGRNLLVQGHTRLYTHRAPDRQISLA